MSKRVLSIISMPTFGLYIFFRQNRFSLFGWLSMNMDEPVFLSLQFISERETLSSLGSWNIDEHDKSRF